MTSTVNRGTTRPTAAQKSAKAAQRNPLSAALKAAAVEVEVETVIEAAIKKVRAPRAKKVVTEVVTEVETVTEPQPEVDPAAASTLSGSLKRVRASRAKKVTPEPAPAAEVVEPSETTTPEPEVAERTTTVPEGATPAVPKAAKKVKEPKPTKACLLAAAGEAAGWVAEVTAVKTSEIVNLTRESERIIANFIDNKLDLGAMPRFIRSDGSTVLLRNASAVKKQMDTDPAARPVHSERRVVAKVERVMAVADKPVRTLPFDVKVASSETIAAHFRKGVKVTARNGSSRTNREMTVPPRSPGLKVEEPKIKVGKQYRTVTFTAIDGKTYSVALDRLLRADALSKDDAADATHAFKDASQKR